MSTGTTTSSRGARLTGWAWAAVPGTGLGLAAAYPVGTALMNALGVAEGDLLTSAGTRGWLAWALVLVITLVVPAGGCVLAILARRAGAGHLATGALAVNALFVVYLVVGSVLQAVHG